MAGVKTYAAGPEGAKFVVTLFHAARHDVLAVIEADHLGRLRTGPLLAWRRSISRRRVPTSLGVIGCGWQAETQMAAMRAALPEIASTVVFCRDPSRREAFAQRGRRRARREPLRRRPRRTSSSRSRRRRTPCCAVSGCAPARSCAPPARTCRATASSTTPCSSAPRSCAATPGGNAKLESGDLIEPVAQGVLDWLEVHELAEVVVGERSGAAVGRRHRRLQVERHRGVGRRCRARLLVTLARERGVGLEL